MKLLLDLLTRCRENGIHFTIDEHRGQLKMRGNVQLLSDAEIDLVRMHREDIMAMYKQASFQPAVITAAALQPHYELSGRGRRRLSYYRSAFARRRIEPGIPAAGL